MAGLTPFFFGDLSVLDFCALLCACVCVRVSALASSFLLVFLLAFLALCFWLSVLGGRLKVLPIYKYSDEVF